MESGHRFDAQTLHSFIQAVFRQMGSEEQEAKLVADHLIAANLAGHDSHGIGMIPSYVRSWSCLLYTSRRLGDAKPAGEQQRRRRPRKPAAAQ